MCLWIHIVRIALRDMQIRRIAEKGNAMASKLLIPTVLGASCMITSTTYLARARYSEYFKESQVISMPVATLDTAALVLEVCF
jgi:hypothetical protein